MSKKSFSSKRFIGFATGILLILCLLLFAFARLKPAPANNRQLLSMIMDGINAVHYSPRTVDDTFSENIFREYIKRVDYNKKFFTQQDINTLSQYKDKIDDEINDSLYDFFDATMEIYYERMAQAYRYSLAPMDKPFDFNTDETIETDGDKLSFPADTNAMKEQWRKYMKLQVLQQITDDEEQQQKAKAKSDTVKLKSFDELEVAAITKVKKSNEEFFSRIRELEYNDWLAAYLDCIANIEDPHTEYFAPVEKQNFDIQISGQLEGIGAQLQEKDGEIKIANIVPGSASWREGRLKAGDVIMKVGQGSAEPVSIEGMRLDKAIQLIRGKKGTEVRLTVKKPDGSVLTVPIIRDVVIIEATYAQSAIININGKKIGYLRLPGFYTVLDQGGRSSAADVKTELKKLEAENVSGIILDLRDNGGGSLQEAVNMGGLFIKTGPMVQVRQRGKAPSMLSDNDPDVTYNGPLTVMVNENSASASEIIAAALQDYHRAVIIGSHSTYGKGTVQNVFNLDDFINRSKNSPATLGSIKITIQKFYRINGGSTQLKGVTPDITLPDPYSQIPYGEKEDKFAIAWDEIPAAKYDPWNSTSNLNDLKSHSAKRVASDPSFQLIQQQAEDYKERRDQSLYSLNYKKFSAQQTELDEKQKKYDALANDSTRVNISNLPADMQKINADSISVARNAQFIKNLKKDVYLNEVSQVVAEMK